MLGRARLKMDLRRKLVTASLCASLGSPVLAQEISTQDYEPASKHEIRELKVTGNGLIEIVYPAEVLAPYKERRPDHQFIFHFQYENLKPAGLGSAAIMGLNLGYKYNVPVVGLEISGFFGSGGSAGGSNGSSYSVQKKGVRAAAVFDDFMNEPYVAPYFGLQIVKWDFDESSLSGRNSASLDPTLGTQVGLLIQLNWLEPKTALNALNEDGLNNSYLDLFLQQYASTKGVNLATSFNWGAGFRMEY